MKNMSVKQVPGRRFSGYRSNKSKGKSVYSRTYRCYELIEIKGISYPYFKEKITSKYL